MFEGSFGERIAKVEGILEQINKRLNHLEAELHDLRAELRNKVDKWEMRIWFIIPMAFISIWSWIILHYRTP
jgi:C4-type Zn-finger protein